MFGLTDNAPVVARASIVVSRPAEEIFHFIGENFFENYPRWSPEVKDLKRLCEGPVQKGTRASQIRVDQGHRTESTFVVTVFEPGRRICFEGETTHYKCDYELKPLNPASLTRVAFTFELPKLELYMLPFEKLIRVVVQDGAERTVHNLKRLIEAESVAAVT